MAKIFKNLKIPIVEKIDEKIDNADTQSSRELIAEELSKIAPGFQDFRILRQSVDARARHHPHFVLTVEVIFPGEIFPSQDILVKSVRVSKNVEKPIVVGTGPAGLFAAVRLVERGIPCRVFERGSQAESRIKGINRFWRYGELDTRNNVCYGEGGAGLYSDGKLITRIKSPEIPYVMDRLVRFGAPEEIRYLSNPHVGSDKIRRVIPKIRQFLIDAGCDLHFETRVTSLLISGQKCEGVRTEDGAEYRSPHTILATGHSAEDVLKNLQAQGVFMEGKSFAMGLRIEHPQNLINQIQYRDLSEHQALGAANYKLTYHDPADDIGVYSFCMCPGGYVLSSGTEADRLVCNGMSNFKRNSVYANAAIVTSISESQHFPGKLWGGLELRDGLERAAFWSVRDAGGTRQLPAQRLVDFLAGKGSGELKGSSPSGVVSVRLDELVPPFMKLKMQEAFRHWSSHMPDFISDQAILYGVETRTSCPVRVTRDPDSLQSVSHAGLYPCGEGAGYAGGITSAACDGIRIADKIAAQMDISFSEPLAGN